MALFEAGAHAFEGFVGAVGLGEHLHAVHEGGIGEIAAVVEVELGNADGRRAEFRVTLCRYC